MKRSVRLRLERVALCLGIASSVVTILAFAFGVHRLADAKDYLTRLAADAPAIIAWPARLIVWIAWLGIVFLYRIGIIFGLPLLPAIPALWLAGVWVRRRTPGSDTPFFIGLIVYFIAMFWLIVTLNNNASFSARLGMG